MNLIGVFFALLTTVSWAIGIFPFTQAARRLGVNPLNHFRLLLATILISLINLLFFKAAFLSIFASSYSSAWFWLGLSGIVGLTIGDHFAFAMYTILGARLGSVLNTFSPAAALILGGLLIHEHISIIGIIGIAITILGVNFISLGKTERTTIPDHGHGSVAKGIIYGILAALCQGAGLVMAKKGMINETAIGNTLQPFSATFIRLSIATLSLYILTTVKMNWKSILLPLKTNQQDGIKYAVAGTIFGPTIGVSLSLYTVSLIDPSVAQTLFSLVPAVAIILAALLFKEKITLYSLFGVIVALLGVVILIWRERILELFN